MINGSTDAVLFKIYSEFECPAISDMEQIMMQQYLKHWINQIVYQMVLLMRKN